jgi:excisionase family DNA binding protein
MEIKNAVENEEYYTPEELAALGHVPLRLIQKWAMAKKLPCVKWGRLNRFPRIEIQKRLLSGSILKQG